MARFGSKKEGAALQLALGNSVRGAATAAGAGERSVARWLAEDPAFAARVRELRSELFGQAAAILAGSSRQAAVKLNTLVGSENEHIALAACRTVLDAASRLREITELEERLAALEAAQRRPEAHEHSPATGKAGTVRFPGAGPRGV